jgi:hypothetical protein
LDSDDPRARAFSFLIVSLLCSVAALLGVNRIEPEIFFNVALENIADVLLSGSGEVRLFLPILIGTYAASSLAEFIFKPHAQPGISWAYVAYSSGIFCVVSSAGLSLLVFASIQMDVSEYVLLLPPAVAMVWMGNIFFRGVVWQSITRKTVGQFVVLSAWSIGTVSLAAWTILSPRTAIGSDHPGRQAFHALVNPKDLLCALEGRCSSISFLIRSNRSDDLFLEAGAAKLFMVRPCEAEPGGGAAMLLCQSESDWDSGIPYERPKISLSPVGILSPVKLPKGDNIMVNFQITARTDSQAGESICVSLSIPVISTRNARMESAEVGFETSRLVSNQDDDELLVASSVSCENEIKLLSQKLDLERTHQPKP